MTLTTGHKKGLWTLISRTQGSRAQGAPRTASKWMCVCDCGTTREVLEQHLVAGRSRSCGCDRAVKHTQAMTAAFAPYGRNLTGAYR